MPPPDHEVIADAIAFAAAAHGDQRYGDGPYVLHPIEVMLLVRRLGGDLDLQVAGLLHDTVEDTAVTLEEIEQRFGVEVARVVGLLTHPEGETKDVYLDRIVADDRAALVKLADSYRNHATLRDRSPNERTTRLAAKYADNITRLLAVDALRGSIDWGRWMLTHAVP